MIEEQIFLLNGCVIEILCGHHFLLLGLLLSQESGPAIIKRSADLIIICLFARDPFQNISTLYRRTLLSLDDSGIADIRILEETPCSRKKYQPKVTTSIEVAAASVKKLLLSEGSCRILPLDDLYPIHVNCNGR